MRLRNVIARVLIRCLPTDTGLHRIKRFVPRIDSSEPLTTIRLRGFPLHLKFDPRTYMGWYLFHRGIYEEAQVRLVKRLLKPGMTFADVGANVGLYTILGAHFVGPAGRVIAIEPQPELADILQSNVELNDLTNVAVETVAVSARPGTAELHQVSISNEGQATLRVREGEKTFGSVAVQCKTLSSVLETHQFECVDGLKLDVEGAELDVLRGFVDHLAARSPQFILFELIDDHLQRFESSGEQLILFLQEHEYDLFCLYRGVWHPIHSSSDHVMCSHSPDLVAVRPLTAAWNAVQRRSG